MIKFMKNKTFFILLLISFIALGPFCLPELIFSSQKFEYSQEMVNKIDDVMNRIYQNGQFSGAILVSAEGEIIYKKAFGYANLEWEIHNTLDTKFRIASATKPFTAMLILQLVEEGKLELNGKLTDYVPEFPNEKGKDITVHQLLTHTSGIIGESKISDLEDIERLYYPRERLLKYISERELSYQPGTGREYSNFGFFLLGVIIERVSGKSYSQLLQDKICKPAGMKNTIPDVNVPLIKNRASGYDYNYLTGPQNCTYLDMSFAFSCGHLLSTVEDLYLWDKALYSEKLLKKKSKDLFFNLYGWFPFRYPYGKDGKRILCKNLDGSVNGFGSHIQRIEKDRIFIAILRNMKERDNQIVIKWPSYMASRILAILYGEEYDMPKKSAAYQIFKIMFESELHSAMAKGHDLFKNHQKSYYFDEGEFETLARKLVEIKEEEKAGEMLNLFKTYRKE